MAWSLMFLAIASNAGAQALFESNDILDVTIEAPLTTFSRDRSDVDYLDGTFSYTDQIGETRAFDLKMRARGRYRRQKSTCNFPPVRLNFKEGQVEGSILGGEDKLKLVTHCQSRRAKNEQYVLREYMTYRILNLLTDMSFRTRLLRITYVDNEDNGAALTRYGFVIEDDDSVGARLELAPREVKALNYRDLDGRQTNLVNLFQYMIGNTDYSLIRGPLDDDCCHNSVPFSDGTIVQPVPYDFDFSGLVNAPYAEPNPQLKIRNVRTRVYRGRCSNSRYLPDSIAHFLSNKDAIYALMDELNDFDKDSRQSVTRYLDEFFDDISDERLVERKLTKKCS